MATERFKIIPAVHLFLIHEGKVLLLRRFNTGFQDGNYSVPAGHIDDGESAIETMIRETKEEAGITLDKEGIKMSHVMHRKSDAIRVDFFFTATSWTGEPSIQEPDKCDELAWYPLDNLPENVIPYVKSALDNTLAGVVYSEFGWDV